MELAWIIPVAALAAIVFSMWMAWDIMRRDTGTVRMQEIAGMIFEGANAFLYRQYRTIAAIAVVTTVIIGVVVGVFDESVEVGILTGVAFVAGSLASGISGFAGMYISVRSNLRCAAAAQRSLKDAITIALRGGAVSGFLITAFSLLGVSGGRQQSPPCQKRYEFRRRELKSSPWRY